MSKKCNLNVICKRDYLMVAASDFHTGHCSGLTHPDYQGKFIMNDMSKHNKFVQIEKELWNFYEKEINTLKKEAKIDIFCLVGDAIDGPGEKSGGTEQISVDRVQQVNMAKKAVDIANANKHIIIQGTAYHVGNQESWEQLLADKFNTKLETHAWLEINKKIFDLKHHIGSSSTPGGRFNALGKEGIWAKLWQESKLIPQPISYLIRAHVHYYAAADDGDMVCLTLPAMQAFGSRYGSTRCSGLPRLGFLSFIIKANGTVIMRKHFANLSGQSAKATVFN